MITQLVSAPRWSTSSFAANTDTLPMELSALGEHLEHCQRQNSRLFTLHCAADATHRFLASRLFTTLTVVVLLISVSFALN